MLKNRVITLILAIVMSVSVCIAINTEYTETAPQAEHGIFETIQEENEIQSENSDINLPAPPKQEVQTNAYKQPISKKKIVFKFLIAMLCVAISSFVIYIGLTLYNRIRDGFVSQSNTSAEEEKSLDAPEDISDAIRTFLEKTKW